MKKEAEEQKQAHADVEVLPTERSLLDNESQECIEIPEQKQKSIKEADPEPLDETPFEIASSPQKSKNQSEEVYPHTPEDSIHVYQRKLTEENELQKDIDT